MAGSNKEDCIYLISHGSYPKLSLEFNVPANINLVQYSIPGLPLSKAEAWHIMEKGCVNVPNYYLVDKQDGEIYKSEFYQYITPPGGSTKDLELDFTKTEMDGFSTGIMTTTGYIETTIFSERIRLSRMLTNISEKLFQNGHIKPVNLIQISCRGGTYTELYPSKTELMRALQSCNKERNYYSTVRNIQMHYLHANAPNLFFITEDNDEAEKLGCLLERNYPIKVFQTVEKIREFLSVTNLNNLPPQRGGRIRPPSRNKRKTIKKRRNK